MRKLLKAYSRKLLTGYGIAFMAVAIIAIYALTPYTRNIFSLLASAVSSLDSASTTMFFRSYGETTLANGGTTSIDVNVNAKIPVDAIGITISFPKDTLEIVGISKEKSFFDLWTEDTSISEDTGEIHVSGGTTKKGGLMGTGTVITLQVKAKAAGIAKLTFTNVQVYPSDGTGDPLNTTTHPISYTIEEERKLPGVISSGGASVSAPSQPYPISGADLNNDGRVNLIDLSILTFKLFGDYDSRYDLNLNGTVGLDDLSILMSKI